MSPLTRRNVGAAQILAGSVGTVQLADGTVASVDMTTAVQASLAKADAAATKLSVPVTPHARTASATLVAGEVTTFTSASACLGTLPSTPVASDTCIVINGAGGGAVTVTDGSTTWTVDSATARTIRYDGANWRAIDGQPVAGNSGTYGRITDVQVFTTHPFLLMGA